MPSDVRTVLSGQLAVPSWEDVGAAVAHGWFLALRFAVHGEFASLCLIRDEPELKKASS